MKTQQELMQAYWGPGGTVDMVKEHNAKHGCDVKPWECVRMTYNGSRTQQGREHPYFDCDKAIYDFALTILYDDKRKEHRPVFVGDKVWGLWVRDWITVDSDSDSNYFSDTELVAWSPPTPKRTFKLAAWNQPAPKRTFKLEFTEEEFYLARHIMKVYAKDMNGIAVSIAEKIELSARDKE